MMKTLCQRRIPAEFDHRVGWIDILTFRRIKTASRAQQSLTAKRKKASFSQTYPPPTGILQKPFKLVEPASQLGHLSRKTGLELQPKGESHETRAWGHSGGRAPDLRQQPNAQTREGLSRLLRRDRIQRSIFLRSVRIQKASSSTFLSCFSIFSALKNS